MANSAKRDANGTWHIQFRYTDWTGKQRKSSRKGFRTKKEAEEWLNHFMLQQSSNPSMPLEDFWEIYKEDMKSRLKATTMANKEHIMRCKILPYFGTTPINEITAAKVRKWQVEMMRQGFKPTYLKTINNQLSAIMNYAVRFYDLNSNPCQKAGSMGKNRADERPHWTLEEFNQFLDAVSDKHEAWMGFQILFWTGIRVGELLALKVEDIDLDKRTIQIDESYTRLRRKDIISAPKTENSIREITIHEELAEDLREYMACMYKPKPESRLFPGKTKRFFEHEMERGIEISGVKKITVHCLRHSHASLLVDMGVSPLAISRRLGHGRVTTTIETYCHPSADAQQKIADALGKVKRGETDGL